MQVETRSKVGVFFAALVIALGGIIYELIIGTVSSYLLSDSVLQFSLTIGFMLFGMGIGSLVSPRYTQHPESSFVVNECLIALVGAHAPVLFFLVFNKGLNLYPLFFITVILIGILIGLEIPLMFSILKSKEDSTKVLSRILSLDYLGSLVASIAFPLVFLPKFGLIRTAYLVGLLNILAAVILYVSFYRRIQRPKLIGTLLVTSVILLSGGAIYANTLGQTLEQGMYKDQIILSQQSAYQKIVLTRFKEDIRLFLNTNLQFSSVDEYRYHEPLVHTALAASRQPKKVLLLGGGDGLAVREILKYAGVEQIVVVDLDPAITELGKTHPLLTALNKNALTDARVQILNQDALAFLRTTTTTFNTIIVDLPDPNDEGLSKLYSREFYSLASQRLAADGAFITQATSPYFSNKTFWLIQRTVASAGFRTYPIRTNVPAFGEWGMILATQYPLETGDLRVTVPTTFLTNKLLPSLFLFDNDLLPKEKGTDVSTILQPRVLSTYTEEARAWRE